MLNVTTRKENLNQILLTYDASFLLKRGFAWNSFPVFFYIGFYFALHTKTYDPNILKSKNFQYYLYYSVNKVLSN